MSYLWSKVDVPHFFKIMADQIFLLGCSCSVPFLRLCALFLDHCCILLENGFRKGQLLGLRQGICPWQLAQQRGSWEWGSQRRENRKKRNRAFMRQLGKKILSSRCMWGMQ